MARFALVLAVLLGAGGIVAGAHHAASAQYDTGRTTQIVGVVTKLVLKNPHSFLEMSEAGKSISWTIEMGPARQLVRAGWTIERLAPGTKIRVSAHPSRDATTHALCCAEIVRFDGSPINQAP
ncbi:MAG TPA: DUF6152 family protein [Vicinamibacterales bacterium]|jgi:hypothetical protein|nr:DUF6152 family protein [Vicinamibacterales bacterium]